MRERPSRRGFLRSSLASAAAVALPFETTTMQANPLNLPIGLQLYTVGDEMKKDPAGTLKRVAEVGYREVELSPLSNMSPAETKRMLGGAGLTTPSGHFLLQDLLSSLPQKIEFAKELGQEYLIVTVPWVADPARFQQKSGESQMDFFLGVLNGLTLDDWRWNAEQFNKLGVEVKKAGLQLGYHNHNFDFKRYGATTGYDEFIRLTDPELVKLELDCGWMVVAGHDPVAYLEKYPDRYRLLHTKDFQKGFKPTTALADKSAGAPVPTELGRGAIDYTKIFAAAKKGAIRAVFVEQEPPFTEMPALEAIAVDYRYLANLRG